MNLNCPNKKEKWEQGGCVVFISAPRSGGLRFEPRPGFMKNLNLSFIASDGRDPISVGMVVLGNNSNCNQEGDLTILIN